MILDANLLIYAADASSRHHAQALGLMTSLVNGDRRVGLPWQSIGAFLRITTNPRATTHPLTGERAWSYIDAWLASPVVWIPPATARTAAVFGELTRQVDITGNLVPDAMLAALAIEHGAELWSADTDFARFPSLRWRNPLNGRRTAR